LKVKMLGRVDAVVTVELSLEELAALEAMFGYGVDGFLQVFYREMGEHYLKPHEKGLRSLADTVGRETGGIVRRIKDADAVLRGQRDVQR
jgi:hypothetical protein